MFAFCAYFTLNQILLCTFPIRKATQHFRLHETRLQIPSITFPIHHIPHSHPLLPRSLANTQPWPRKRDERPKKKQHWWKNKPGASLCQLVRTALIADWLAVTQPSSTRISYEIFLISRCETHTNRRRPSSARTRQGVSSTGTVRSLAGGDLSTLCVCCLLRFACFMCCLSKQCWCADGTLEMVFNKMQRHLVLGIRFRHQHHRVRHITAMQQDQRPYSIMVLVKNL